MKYYCPVCNKPAWFYNNAEPESYCEYCDQNYPTEDFYPDEEEADNDRFWDAVDDRVHEYLIEHRNN